jgi:hypothetical protein
MWGMTRSFVRYSGGTVSVYIHIGVLPGAFGVFVVILVRGFFRILR